MRESDLASLDINETARTVTVADDALLFKIAPMKRVRMRGLDLPPNP